MPKSRQTYPPMGPNMGKMSITPTHKFIMERARAVGNVPMRRAKPASPSSPGTKKSPMQGKSTRKYATGGPSSLKVPGPRFNKKRILSTTTGPVLRGQQRLASTPEVMAKGPYRNRTLGEPEFGQYKGGTGKRGQA